MGFAPPKVVCDPLYAGRPTYWDYCSCVPLPCRARYVRDLARFPHTFMEHHVAERFRE